MDRDLEQLTIIGSGTMGHSIALNAAWMGISVIIQGLTNADLDQALAGIDSKLNVLLAHDLIDKKSLVKIKSTIKTTTHLDEALKKASFVIEAIPENINLKKDLFNLLGKKCGEEVVLASNTSGISPFDIAVEMNYPERFIITHFWNPAHLIPLVEIVCGPYTNSKTLERTKRLLQIMKKKTIEVKKPVPGFIGNRLQYALFREAQFLLEEGIASKEDIDTAVTYSIGRRLPVTGPLLSADLGGLDVFASISEYLFKGLSDSKDVFRILKNLTKDNKLGTKSGEGFYTWTPDFTAEVIQKRESELIRFLKCDLQKEI